MSAPDRELRAWVDEVLHQVRWFAGKGRGGQVSDLRLLTTWVDSLEPIRSWLVEVRYPDASLERYHLVVEHTREGPREPSAKGWQDFWTALTNDLQGNQRLDEEVPGWADLPARLLDGEQSNTSLLVGDALIVKLYRRLEPGQSVESEMAELLDGEPTVARNYATVGLDPGLPRHGPVELLSVSEQFGTARDGWRLATEAPGSGTDFTTEARALGATLRRVHHTLARRAGTAEVAGSRIAAAMTARLAAAADEVTVLTPHVASCRQAFEVLAGTSRTVQRVHGDFHLGQALRVAAEDWRIIDFAGEPLKTLDERRAPDCVERDVAGMLRSFGYADLVGQDPVSTSEAGSVWMTACREAFVSGYRSGDASPTDDERAALRAYEVDKAIYDVVYETRNRPGWVPLAVSALDHLLHN